MEALNRVKNLAVIGVPRLFFLSAGVQGLSMIAELALRGCERIASTTGVSGLANKAGTYTPKSVKDLKNEIAESKFVEGLRPFTSDKYAVRDLVRTGIMYLTVSALGLWAMEALPFVGKPHDIYNKVLSNISYIQLRETGSPFMTMKETFSQIKTRIFG